MIFTKSAFSIKIQKTMKFHSIFGGQNEKKSNKNRFKKALFLSIAFSKFFLRFWLRFGIQKSSKNHNFSKKLRFEGFLRSSIALKLLFEWILKPSEFDFHGFRTSRRCFLIALSGEQKYAWSMSGCRPYFDD